MGKSRSLSGKPTFLLCIPEKLSHQLLKQLPLLQNRNWHSDNPPPKFFQTHNWHRLISKVSMKEKHFYIGLCNINIKDASVRGCSLRYCREAILCACKSCSSSLRWISRVTLNLFSKKTAVSQLAQGRRAGVGQLSHYLFCSRQTKSLKTRRKAACPTPGIARDPALLQHCQ